MASEILVKINVESGQATTAIKKVKKDTDSLSSSVKLYTKEQKKAAVADEESKLKKKEQTEEIKRLAKETLIAGKSVGVYSSNVGRNTKGLKQNRAQTGLNNAILIETGRVASDAAYGIQGIGNNLGRLIELGQEYSRTGQGGMLGAFKQLRSSLWGIGGIIVGVQLFLSYAPMLFKAFREWSVNAGLLAKTFGEAAKSVGSLNGNFELYTMTLQDSSKGTDEHRDALDALVKEYPDFIKNLKESNISIEDLSLNTSEAKRVTDEYRESIVKLAMAEASRDKIVELQSEKLQIRLDRETRARENGFKSYSEVLDVIASETEKSDEMLAQSGTKNSTYVNTRLIEAKKIRDLKISDGDFDGKQAEEAIELIDKQTKTLLEFTDIKSKASKPVDGKGLFESDLSIKSPYDNFDFDTDLVLKDIIEYIDDVEEESEIYALNKGKQSLLSKILKLEPNSREKDLKVLRDTTKSFGVEALFLTEEYAKAQQAIHDKYDLIERKSKVSHLKGMLGQLSGFLNSAAQIAEGNKDLARASIIASAAAASVGVWESWLVKDPTFTPAPYKVAGAVATQLAVVASTVSALKSLNSGTPINGGGAASVPRNVQAPSFNVVGASATNQLAQTVAGQVNAPLRAYVVGSDISDQQELDRSIISTAGIG